MNYLAHLHIAEASDSNLLGNLLGDFVKGNPSEQYSEEIVQGIRLHRWVDAYTDSHEVMILAKALFPATTRRFSPIALDMFWDHCLAKHWQRFHSQSLRQFVLDAERKVKIDHSSSLPERYMMVSDKMWQGRWLESYAEFENIHFALQRMSLRRERMKPLAECYVSLEDSYQELESLFFSLYPQVLEKAKSIRF
ncbi:acyl carrier protein phosphodiesterase [Vibrio diazotrophicus]|uniref:acyl carrier protein phosphodiesterase n=1 Tax=Vibrio diazotrophicus TaxID=685 RepID=UPI000C9E76E8|nr:ACP phosphodiesterase [Vibrio diazotrophicus]PNH77710.1 ACP phosphodiesterase [Vibrio diazotrophicus]PNH95534.1 ACP phosphodiesterase [Vibrio diazotrophicus]